MKYPEFKLESYLAVREFSAPFTLCSSDLETYSMHQILQMAERASFSLWEELPLSYTETRGHPLLREEISTEYGQAIGQEQILCLAGAQEGIYCMAHTLLDRADHAIVVTPCYQSLKSLPSAICSTTTVRLQYQKGWELDVEEIAHAIQPSTKLIVLNFPHNPTGALITQKTLSSLVDLARKHDLWIFSDEVYRLLELNQQDRLAPIAALYEKGMSLGVLSKAYGLPGLRIGWIACQDINVLDKMNKMKHYLSICNSAPSEILALIALKASAQIQKRNHYLMQNNLKRLELFFREYADWFEWVRPKGGCIGYPLFKGGIPIEQLTDELLEQSGVLLLPGSVYDDDSNHFRISFGRKSMPEALDRVGQFIEKNKGQWRP